MANYFFFLLLIIWKHNYSRLYPQNFKSIRWKLAKIWGFKEGHIKPNSKYHNSFFQYHLLCNTKFRNFTIIPDTVQSILYGLRIDCSTWVTFILQLSQTKLCHKTLNTIISKLNSWKVGNQNYLQKRSIHIRIYTFSFNQAFM